MTSTSDEASAMLAGSSTFSLAKRDARLAALMTRVVAADRRAFEELYRATSATLFGVVLRINRDRGCAEEVLQEVFITAWRQASSYDRGQARVMTWLTTIARNRAIDSVRRKSSQPVTTSHFGGLENDASAAERDGDLLDAMSGDQPSPLELLAQVNRAHALERCMVQLSGEQRSCLALAYYQGLSHAEVAVHMHQPLGTVKSWVRRGLMSLRTCLDRAAQRIGAIGKVA